MTLLTPARRSSTAGSTSTRSCATSDRAELVVGKRHRGAAGCARKPLDQPRRQRKVNALLLGEERQILTSP